jgi:hypothetical protein
VEDDSPREKDLDRHLNMPAVVGQADDRNVNGSAPDLADLSRLWDRVGGPLDKLGGHLVNAQKQYEETSRAFERFTNRLESIAEKADEIAAPDSEGVTLLPPS